MRRHFSPPRPARGLRRLYRRWPRPEPSRTSLARSMAEGAGVGFLAATVLTALLVAGIPSTAQLVFFSSLGLLAGGVVGVLLWIGSAPLPEDSIPVPGPGQARSRFRRR